MTFRTLLYSVVIAMVAVACDSSDSSSPEPTVTTSVPAPAPTQSPTAAPAQPPQPAPRPGSPGGSVEERRAHEKSFIPALTAVQRWDEVAVSGRAENFAPSVVKLPDGRYRMYANSGQARGIISLISSDGISFTEEPGERLSKAGSDPRECTSSHPWVVAMDGGWRMYYQGNAKCDPTPNSPVEYRIFSAFSKDGLTFVREGVRVDTGEATGLRQAAHGRIVKMPDGSYQMYFSADLIGKEGPADLLGATSTDGLTWAIDPKPILERAHDPTAIMLDGKVVVFATFLGDNLVVLESTDGRSFSPTTWVDFHDRAGTRIEEFGDVDVMLLADGRLALYGTGKGSKGVSTMLSAAR